MADIEKKYLLEEWQIFPEKSAIQRNDEIIHLEPKIMEVLVYLLINANRVVSREELTEQVWQSRYASDEVITRAISVLRKKLDDTGKVHRFIKTIPKHGYVLEHHNEQQQADLNSELIGGDVEPPQEGFTQKINRLVNPLWALIVAIIALILLFSVVGMQLVQTNSRVDNGKISMRIDDFHASDNLASSAMVARVLTEQLVTTLSNSPSAEVVVNSDMLDGLSESYSEYLISGGVKEVANEYHINLHFSAVESGNVLWSQTFAGEKSSWHQLVSNISQTIEYFINVAEKEQLDLHSMSLNNLQTALIKHQARAMRISGRNDDYKMAVQILENSIITYPDDIELMNELVLTHLQWYTLFGELGSLKRVEQLLNRLSVELNKGSLYELSKALFDVQGHRISYKDALTVVAPTLQTKTDDVEVLVLVGNLYRLDKQYTQALDLYQQAYRIEPDYSLATLHLARLESQLGNNTKAISQLEMFYQKHNDNYNIYFLLVSSYVDNGKFSNAINLIHQVDPNEHKNKIFEQLGSSYYYLNLLTPAIDSYNKIDVSGSPILQFQQQCLLFILQQEFSDGKESCKLSDQNEQSMQSQFYYARNLMLQGLLKEAEQQYQLTFAQIEKNYPDVPPTKLINEKVDYIWLLAKNGNQQQANLLAKPLLEYFADNKRIGYLGYGINDVIILLAMADIEAAGNAFSDALEAGWLHWHSWQYGGPHPALKELVEDRRYEQWMQYIQKSIHSQQQKLDSKLDLTENTKIITN